MANDKAIAMIISFIFTGAGLIYLGDENRGFILLGTSIVLNLLGMWVSPIFSYLSIIIWIYGLYATYMKAQAVE